jgi:hypothetical protein
MTNIGPTLITVIGGIIGLAIVAVLVSKNAQTPQVFQTAGTALSAIIGAAVQPVAASSNVFGTAGH